MKRYFVIAACLLMILANQGRGQTPQTKLPVIPPGPLIIEHMPDYAQWAIDYTYTDAPKPGQESDLVARYRKLAQEDPSVAKAMADPHFLDTLEPARPIHVVVTKTGVIRHVDKNLERSLHDEIWMNGDVTIERRPGVPNLVVSLGNPLIQNDFPEFSWISKEAFSGVESVNGHPCLVFKQQVDPVGLEHPGLTGIGGTIPVIAYVDLKTRYPVSLQFGVETRQISILSAPTEQLVVPDEFAAAAKTTLDRIQKAIPRLSPP